MSSPSSDKKLNNSNMPNKVKSPCFDSSTVSYLCEQLQRLYLSNSLPEEVDDKRKTMETFDTKESGKKRDMSQTIKERYTLCKKNLRISVTKEEIEEDFIALTCKKPPTIKKIREKTVQRNLDNIFPGIR
nr:hypothetical protein [Tanacetum cinerariifolium]